MIDCISVENMRASDAYTIEKFVPSLTLMHRAAFGVFKAVHWQGSVAIVVGSGNNGGDGFALACILYDHQIACKIFTVSNRYTTDSVYYAQQAAQRHIPVEGLKTGGLSGFSIVVDCLLGTGFSGNLRDNYRAAIEEINSSGAYVVSVDINSGMNGDTGEAELAVRSDLTVTVGFVKTGLVTEYAGTWMQRLVCADIGIVLEKEEWKLCRDEELFADNCLAWPNWLDSKVIVAY